MITLGGMPMNCLASCETPSDCMMDGCAQWLAWEPANNRREAHYADVNGVRLFVQKTVRADRCPLARSDEYQARVNGIRVGEFVGLAVAQRAAIAAATKKAPALSRGGVWWC